MHRTRMPFASHARRSRQMPSPRTHSTARGGAREPQAYPPPCKPHAPPRAAADISLGPTGLPALSCLRCLPVHVLLTTRHTRGPPTPQIATPRYMAVLDLAHCPRSLCGSLGSCPIRAPQSWSCVGKDPHPTPGHLDSLPASLASAVTAFATPAAPGLPPLPSSRLHLLTGALSCPLPACFLYDKPACSRLARTTVRPDHA